MGQALAFSFGVPTLRTAERELGNMAKVDSPCLGICQLDLDSALCIGCFRTRDEVAVWGAASDGVKRDILAKTLERRVSREEGNLR